MYALTVRDHIMIAHSFTVQSRAAVANTASPAPSAPDAAHAGKGGTHAAPQMMRLCARMLPMVA